MKDLSAQVAVLVDGENVSPKHASKIRKLAQARGIPQIIRVYMDARSGSNWHSCHGYRVMHTGVGKNAADMLLAIDAMELLLERKIMQFLIASSDRDFTHLVLRLREYGASVVGLGEKKAPDSFRECCSQFIELEETQILQPKIKTPKNIEMDIKIKEIISRNSEDNQGMKIADLSPKMYLQHGVKISTFPEKTWRGYLKARPHLFELDARGQEARVRLVLEN